MCPYIVPPGVLGPLAIGTYGLMMAIGFLWAWRFLRRSFAWRGWDPEFAYTIIVNSMISGVIGARLFHVIDHWESFRHDLIRIVTANSGLTWYGGLILALITSYYFCRRRGVPFISAVDATAPMIASGYAFGRLGCLLAGDGCYGIPVEPPWEFIGMAFPNGLVPTVEKVHPTPLYEAVFNFALFGALLWIDRHRTVPHRWPHGRLFAIFLVLHSVERFLVEFIRLNSRYWFEDGELIKIGQEAYYAGQFGLSFSQWISIAGIVVGTIWLLAVRNRRAPPFPIQQPAPAAAGSASSGKESSATGSSRKGRGKRRR